MAASRFALFDCAADPSLYGLVKAAPGALCLYAGAIHPDLAPAAPYIIELRRDDPFMTHWRRSGWGRNWGLLCESSLSLALLRFHFRHFLRAKLPDRRVVEFRFYDPRVFRAYMPTCEPTELASWFDGVSRYVVESGDGAGALEFSRIGGALSVRDVKLP